MNEKTKWILSPPGGPAGPFWGVVATNGGVIALQIVDRLQAEILVIMNDLSNGDFEIVRGVGAILRDHLKNDLSDYEKSEFSGAEDYLIRAVSEAIMSYCKEIKE